MIENLDREIEVLDVVGRHVLLRKTQLQIRRNSRAPINAVPIELLLKIFKFYLEDACICHYLKYRHDRYFASLHVLAQVSRRWEDVIASSPQLWARLCATDHPSIWKSALGRSQSHLLEVIMPGWNQGFPKSGVNGSNWHKHADFWTSIGQNINRWRKAKLTVSCESSARLLEQDEALNLTDLDLTLLLRQPLTLDLFRGNAPKLANLRLEKVVLPEWESVLLSNLRELTLEQIADDALTTEKILQILERCPDLELASFSHLRLTYDPSALAPTVQPNSIVLPKLRRLAFKFMGPLCVVPIVSALRADRLKSFTVELGDDFDVDDTSVLTTFVTAGLTSCILACESFVCNVRVDDEAQQAGGFSLEIKPDDEAAPGFYFNLIYCHGSEELLLDWAQQCLNSHDALVYSSHITIAELPPSIVLIALRQFQDVAWVYLMNFDENIDDILSELASPRVHVGDHGQLDEWLCPELCCLALFNCTYSDPSLLLSVAEARLDTLRRFHVTGRSPMNPDTRERLEGLLGKHFLWAAEE